MPDQRPGFSILPAARGMGWVSAALVLLRRQLVRLLLLGLLLQLLGGLTQFGALGILFVLCVPALTAGMLQGLHATDAGMRPSPGVLFAAFAKPDRLLRLMLLGGLMLAVALAAVMLVLSGSLASVDADVIARLEQGDVGALLAAEPGLLERLLLALLAGLLVSGSVSYFSVPLIWFLDAPLGKSVVGGLAAMLRNWKPFLVLAAFLAVLAVPIVLLSGLALTLSAAGTAGSQLWTLAMLLGAVVYQVLLFATQYVAFRDIFGPQGPATPHARGDGQLVA